MKDESFQHLYRKGICWLLFMAAGRWHSYARASSGHETERRDGVSCQEIFDSVIKQYQTTEDSAKSEVRQSAELDQELLKFLRIYFSPKSSSVSPREKLEAFREFSQKMRSLQMTQKDLQQMRDDIVQNHYPDIFYPDQKDRTFIFTGHSFETMKQGDDFYSIHGNSPFVLAKELKKERSGQSSDVLDLEDFQKNYPEMHKVLMNYYRKPKRIDFLNGLFNFRRYLSQLFGGTENYSILQNAIDHSSRASGIIEVEQYLDFKYKTSNPPLRPKLWLIGDKKKKNLIATSILKDTLNESTNFFEKKIVLGDSIHLTGDRFYFQLSDKKNPHYLMIYFYHTSEGLKVGSAEMIIHSFDGINLIPFSTKTSVEIQDLLKKIKKWLVKYNADLNPVLQQAGHFGYEQSSIDYFRTMAYLDPVRDTISMLLVARNKFWLEKKHAKELIKFIEIPLNDEEIHEHPLPDPILPKKDFNEFEIIFPDQMLLKHYGSDVFEFQYIYRVRQKDSASSPIPSQMEFDFLQTIHLVRRSAMGPPK